MAARDSSDDFFSSFDGDSPPKKTSQALKPPPSSGNAVKAPPPPPPPPRRPAAPAAGTAAAAGRPATSAASRRATPPPPPKPQAQATQQTIASTTTTTPSFYGQSSTTPPAGTSTSAASATSASGGATKKPGTRPMRSAKGKSRIASGGTSSMSSSSYYAQQQQQKPATSLMSQQQTHLTAPSAASTQQPAMFNPAASAYQNQQPQQQQQPQASYYGHAAPAPAVAEPDTSGDWFNPDAEDDSQPQTPAAPAANPFAQSALLKSSSSLEGRMDGGTAGAPSMFVPTPGVGSAPTSGGGADIDFENEPPLMEELGINIEHILLKVKAVVIPFKRFSGEHSALLDPAMIVEDADLAGPAAFALLLGGELLLTGKIHFGYIYGFGVFGCLSMTLVLNLMSPSQAVSVWTVTSILGYALIPVNVLAAVKIVLVNIANLATLGQILALLTVLWSTTASVRLLEVGCGMRDQRYLLAYPIALLYSAFVLITIF